jgi:hypothetical protein
MYISVPLKTPLASDRLTQLQQATLARCADRPNDLRCILVSIARLLCDRYALYDGCLKRRPGPVVGAAHCAGGTLWPGRSNGSWKVALRNSTSATWFRQSQPCGLPTWWIVLRLNLVSGFWT